MKLNASAFCRRRLRTRGISLIECLVYLGAFALVFGLGLLASFRCFDNASSLRRNSDDITQALQAGELWRADIRTATQPIQFDPAEQTLRISHGENEVTYKFADNQILRRARTNAIWFVVLQHVQQSQMTPTPRAHVTGWNWELELHSRRQPTLLRPLFTFTAAPHTP